MGPKEPASEHGSLMYNRLVSLKFKDNKVDATRGTCTVATKLPAQVHYKVLVTAYYTADAEE